MTPDKIALLLMPIVLTNKALALPMALLAMALFAIPVIVSGLLAITDLLIPSPFLTIALLMGSPLLGPMCNPLLSTILLRGILILVLSLLICSVAGGVSLSNV